METNVTILMAFVFGVLSFFTPCVLPLVPAYLSYISGVSVEELTTAKGVEALRRTGLKSIVFVLGFSIVFVAMGATATSIGQFLSAKTQLLMEIAGVVIIIFGLHTTGIFRIRALYSEKRVHLRIPSAGYTAPFVLGIVFALGWTPCIGPVLAGILALAADSKTLSAGMGLLAVYSLGLGIPFVVTGFATGYVLKALGRFKRHFRKVEIVSGVLMIIAGVLIFTGELQRLSF